MPVPKNPNIPFFTEKRVTLASDTLPPITTLTINIKKSADLNEPKPFICSGKLELAMLPQEWKNIQNVEQPRINIAAPTSTHTLEQCIFLYDEKSSMFLIEAHTFI